MNVTSEIDRAVGKIRRARRDGDLEAVILGLQHGDIVSRRVAARSLGLMGDNRAREPLQRVLESHDELLQATALKALGRLGDVEAIPAIAEIANTRAAFAVRTNAIEALLILGDRRGIRLLTEIATTNSFDSTWNVAGKMPAVSERPGRTWALKKLLEHRGVEAIASLESYRQSSLDLV